MQRQLPLFPLGTVLFPGLLLPVHVFELRYRQLMAELLAAPASQPRRFGVVAIRRGSEVGGTAEDDGVQALYDVGCIAEVRRIREHPDGRFDVTTSGTARFRLLAVHRPTEETRYLRGDVETLPERVGEPANAARLAERVRAAFPRYLAAVAAAQGSPVEAAEVPADPLLLSYLVAATMMLDLPERQELLAAPSAAHRLAGELRLLGRETGLLRALSAAPATDLAHAHSVN